MSSCSRTERLLQKHLKNKSPTQKFDIEILSPEFGFLYLSYGKAQHKYGRVIPWSFEPRDTLGCSIPGGPDAVPDCGCFKFVSCFNHLQTFLIFHEGPIAYLLSYLSVQKCDYALQFACRPMPLVFNKKDFYSATGSVLIHVLDTGYRCLLMSNLSPCIKSIIYDST